MHTSYAMMASSVTPPTEDEGAGVDGAVEAGGATFCVWGCLSLNCGALCQTVVSSMSHIYVKWGDSG